MHRLHSTAANLYSHFMILPQLPNLFGFRLQVHGSKPAPRIRRLGSTQIDKQMLIVKYNQVIYICRDTNVFI
jgi:hypothetical protein